MDLNRDSERPCLTCLLFCNIESVPLSVFDNIAEPQLDNVAYSETQVSFQDQGSCDPFVWPAACKA